jgi:hypothetical protein
MDPSCRSVSHLEGRFSVLSMCQTHRRFARLSAEGRYGSAVRFPGRRAQPDLSREDAQTLGIGELGPGDDRLLSWSPLALGGLAAATEAGLHVITPLGKAAARPWTEVSRASWDAESSALAVWWIGGSQPMPLEIIDQSRLPDVIYDRVRRSILISTEVVLDDGRSVWVALRRSGGETFLVQAVAPAGVRLDDPDVAPLVAAAKSDLRSQAGLE